MSLWQTAGCLKVSKHSKGLIKNTKERFIEDRKNFIENEVSLRELALNVSNLYEYEIKYDKRRLFETDTALVIMKK